MLVVAKYSKENAAFATEAEALADFTSGSTEEQTAEWIQFESDSVNSGLISQPLSYEWTDGNTIIVVFNMMKFFTQGQMDTILAREEMYTQSGWTKFLHQVNGQDIVTTNGRHYINGALVPLLPS